jgi:hypothetical protein
MLTVTIEDFLLCAFGGKNYPMLEARSLIMTMYGCISRARTKPLQETLTPVMTNIIFYNTPKTITPSSFVTLFTTTSFIKSCFN